MSPKKTCRESITGTRRSMRFSAGLFVVSAVVLSGLAFVTDAQAAAPPSGNSLGNGEGNHNLFVINVFSRTHEIQHVRNGNIGGNTAAPPVICGKSHRCRLTQHLVVH
jgi:hypothetical protein